MDKELAFCYPPIIDSYSGVAGNVGVQMTNEKYIPLIIYNHYLVTYSEELGCAGFNWRFYNDDYGQFYDLRPETNEKGLLEAIRSRINEDYYIHAYVDHYYIKGCDRYLIRHFLHDCSTIIGYDDDFFLVADNFRGGKYEVLKVSNKDLELALTNNMNKAIEYFDFPKSIDFVLKKEDVILLLQGYKNMICYFTKKNLNNTNLPKDEVWGQAIYSVLERNVNEVEKGNMRLDVRNFHVVINHMKVGILLAQYLNKHKAIFGITGDIDNIISKYKEMDNKAFLIEKMYLKLGIYIENARNLNTVTEKKKELIDMIGDLQNDEIKVVDFLLEKLM